MSRARNIKPGFFKNDRLAECSPLTRILFAALWCEADREGRLEDRPKRLKAECLPYDDCDVDSMLDELAEREFIVRYSHGKDRYIQVLAFNKHQNPHMREPASTIPAPCKHSASTVQEPEKPESAPEQNHGGTEPAGLFPLSPSLIPDSGKKIGASPDGKALPLTAERQPAIPYQAIVTAYNATMVNLPKVREISADRKTAMRKAWMAGEQRQSVEFWRAYFEECAAEPFTNGTGPYTGEHANWRPDFDYLMRGKVITRIFERAMDRLERSAA